MRLPDRRRFLLRPEEGLDSPPGGGEVWAAVEEGSDLDRALRAAGFEAGAVETRFRVRLAYLPAPRVSGTYELISPDQADLTRLQRLDETLRDDLPGPGGWRWTPEGFRAETFGPDYDPRTYLVDSGYRGLVRVWQRPQGPRLGHLGVVRSHRRTRLTAQLLGTVLAELRRQGHRTLDFEVADANRASLALLRHARAEPVGREVQLHRA